MSQEAFPKSLWAALAAPGRAATRLAGEIDADVLVVGGGYLGLSTALHLAEAGVGAVLLEAEEAGFGASGRNTGFVVPTLKIALGPAEVTRHLGPEFAGNLNRLVGNSGDTVFSLIERLGIACSAERTGCFQPAHSAAKARILERRSVEWQEFGAGVEMVSADETRRRLGVAGYHGALFVRTGGQINPLAYARGLARACVERGVAVYHGARVLDLTRSGDRWVAKTAAGTVRASRVLLATNAMGGRLMPALADSIVPTRIHQIATQPLPSELQASILPERTPSADTRRHTFAVRWSPDGRLLTGGLVMPGPGAAQRAARSFSGRLRHFFPELGPLRAEYVWSGMIAVTMDSLPRFMTLAPGLDAAIGCNGRGIALTTALGRDIARLYCGAIAPGDFALPLTRPQPVPGRQLARVGPHLYLPWSEFRDWVDSKALQ